jgi:hypothetical protein
MANYKELEGFGVQTLATDPDTPGWVGSIFYNSTSGTFKVVKPGGVTAGTWSSGGNLNEPKTAVAGAGIQTAALAAGGYFGPPILSSTELYNGTSWTEVNDLNTARYYLGGAGSQTAAIATAGKTDPNVDRILEWYKLD